MEGNFFIAIFSNFITRFSSLNSSFCGVFGLLRTFFDYRLLCEMCREFCKWEKRNVFFSSSNKMHLNVCLSNKKWLVIRKYTGFVVIWLSCRLCDQSSEVTKTARVRERERKMLGETDNDKNVTNHR